MIARTGRRRWLRAVVVAVVVAAVVAGGVLVWERKPWAPASPAAEGNAPAPAVTAPVVRGTLINELRLNATLGYDDAVELPTAAGMLTALPAVGKVVKVGSPVYEADGRPVILLRGARPFWRELARGVRDGKDVLQLERNLARLGFFTRKPDTRFDWWTRDAVRKWQRKLGVPVTGVVANSDVVVVNAPGIRVAQVTGRLGQTGVSPLAYTATRLRAVAKLTAAQARELQPGTRVTVVLSDGKKVKAKLAAVDPGGQPAKEEGQTTPPTAVVEFPDQTKVAEVGPGSVRVLVKNGVRTDETLIVPATALIATARDSYAVEVQTTEGIVRVPVAIGLVADARVQVLASGSDVDGAPAGARRLREDDEAVLAR
ncbi:MAG: peptidoglycan-binding protein [Tessaracoccus sp.]|uniref:peptidoglycan-binding domain-containing protein n=1 Tax=Tessaracoccus sp. TaxID=1971211 RepID=UPI001EC9CFF8|nr:peptidoglycan-binding domain-containing protein [Tessaracoccus sp.]MBK7820427.1 peptidoglycan-binding protein [Tessaracoccus sp.]